MQNKKRVHDLTLPYFYIKRPSVQEKYDDDDDDDMITYISL